MRWPWRPRTAKIFTGGVILAVAITFGPPLPPQRFRVSRAGVPTADNEAAPAAEVLRCIGGGDQPNGLALVEASRAGGRYFVELVHEDGHLCLGRGWMTFADQYGVDIGFFLAFEFDGEDELVVKMYDGTQCRRSYRCDGSGDSSGDVSGEQPY